MGGNGFGRIPPKKFAEGVRRAYPAIIQEVVLINKLAKIFIILCCTLSIFNQPLRAEEQEKPAVRVADVVRGNYFDYHPEYRKYTLVTMEAFAYPMWYGKIYMNENNLKDTDLIERCHDDAQKFAIGFARGYLKVTNPGYSPNDYMLVVDQYNATMTETDVKMSTLISGNVMLFRINRK